MYLGTCDLALTRTWCAATRVSLLLTIVAQSHKPRSISGCHAMTVHEQQTREACVQLSALDVMVRNTYFSLPRRQRLAPAF